jgi:hypothetical protein
LAFLTDTTDKLNSLNLRLQGRDKYVTKVIGSLKPFKAELVSWMLHTKAKSLVHFQSIKIMESENDFSQLAFSGHPQILLE